jgi:hypothetical protein
MYACVCCTGFTGAPINEASIKRVMNILDFDFIAISWCELRMDIWKYLKDYEYYGSFFLLGEYVGLRIFQLFAIQKCKVVSE